MAWRSGDRPLSELLLSVNWRPQWVKYSAAELIREFPELNYWTGHGDCMMSFEPWCRNGPLARYANLRVRMRRKCRERFPRHHRQAIPTCITARASRTCRDACRDRQLTVSFEIGGGGKRSRHSRRMRNLQFYVSGKRPMVRAGCHDRIVGTEIFIERTPKTR